MLYFHSSFSQNNPIPIYLDTMSATYKTSESKREEFRKYLEKEGVLDSLTKILVCLYEEPEKPINALDFLKQHLHGGSPESNDVETLRLELQELRTKHEAVVSENEALKAKLQEYETPAEEKEAES